MAALTTQVLGNGGAITTTAAAGGGDTVEAGSSAGGWSSGTVLVVVVGGTATTVTVNGVAQSPLTSQTALYLVNQGYMGARVPITYSQVTGVTVAAVRAGSALTGITFGT